MVAAVAVVVVVASLGCESIGGGLAATAASGTRTQQAMKLEAGGASRPSHPALDFEARPPLKRPPRGYCAPISRAIAPSSRCYKHLVAAGAKSKRHSRGRPQSGQSARLRRHRLRPLPLGQPTEATIESTSATATSADNRHLVGAKSLGANSTTTTTTRRARAFVADDGFGQTAGEDEDDDDDDDDGQASASAAAGDSAQREELVYVRLEILGSTIRDLSTRAVNERLLLGLFDHLLAAGGGGRDQTATASAPDAAHEGAIEAVRAQILSSPPLELEGSRLANRCRKSMEKFLCRLAYPSCHFRASDVSALVRPPCREDCLLLRDVLCANLNWSKFALELERAFNITLMSTINALDLETQGESLAKTQEQEHEQAPIEAAEPTGINNPPPTAGHHNEQQHITRGYNLNSSIHFYWPHEHSVQKCELLPPLRPLQNQAIDGQPLRAALEAAPRGHRGRHSRRGAHPSFADVVAEGGSKGVGGSHHHDKRPICSHAHLTQTGLMVDLDDDAASGRHKLEGAGHSTDCLDSDDGINYRGTKNTTMSGHECQPWINQWPHSHTSSELLFDNMRGANNFCRNPGGAELRPWCYTMSMDVRWEYCDIKSC